MTTKEQRKQALKAIGLVWDKHPELRLGQLILNVISEYELYYISDSDFIKRIKICYAILKGRL